MDFPFDLSKLDMGGIMNMARDLKAKMDRMEESLGRITVEAMVGGGMVTVKANGLGEVLAITIDQELVGMNDKAMIENLVLTGVNQALIEAKSRRDEEMRKLSGGMPLPGMFLK